MWILGLKLVTFIMDFKQAWETAYNYTHLYDRCLKENQTPFLCAWLLSIHQTG